MEKINQLANKCIQQADLSMGYHANRTGALKSFYEWYIKSGLCKTPLLNVGDPNKECIYQKINTQVLEVELVDKMGKLFGFKENWGFVTSSGTDGNMHASYYGSKMLQNPIVYASDQAHFSIQRITESQNLELKLIKSDLMGCMSSKDFEEKVDIKRDALIILTIGSTFKGGIDDFNIINILKEKGVKYYVHVDAALFGSLCIYLENMKHMISNDRIGYDSICISGHKFFGIDEPCGLLLTTKYVFENINSLHVNYMASKIPTITSCRSGLTVLKWWWLLNTKEYQIEATTMIDNAIYLEKKLKDSGVEVYRNLNIVFFTRPKEDILLRYNLSPEEDGRLGPVAHVVVMQHVNIKLIDNFIDNLK